jgi:hypothetical protein
MAGSRKPNGGTPDYLGGEGTGTGDGASGTGAIEGKSEPIQPRDVDGSGNSGTGSGDDFDPAIHVGRDKRNADGSYTRKRGRKAGNSSGSRKASAAADLGTSIEALSKTLVIIHTGIAGVTGVQELVIDKSEGDMLAHASANVLAQFDITPDPKTQAIIGMIMACGAVYGPRAFAYRMRKAHEKAAETDGVASVINPDGSSGTTTYSAQPN